MSERYNCSEKYLERALAAIPLGSQTFSKSKQQYPHGAAPFFLERGEGARVWDIDGNEYIDFVNGLLAVSLGYNDPDVNAAVEAQLKRGVSFSLPHRLETELAEQIIAMVPCAEQVRFGKNGSDATTGAIRLARAYTERDHIALCGYHGWQDWSIGTTARDRGIPAATKALSHAFSYNDLDSLKAIFDAYPHQVAAVILEPMNTTFPENQFLEKVKALAHQQGALLIFDEVITGFRFAKGGAQEYFGVTPDLVALGKGMANGYPLSVLAGPRELMCLLEEIFFSFTFGGETLSLAAAQAVLKKIASEPVIETLALRGQRLLTGLKKRIMKHRLEHCIKVSGHPAWTLLQINADQHHSAWAIKTFFKQEMLVRGILISASHNISYAHSEADIDMLLKVYDEVLLLMAEALKQDDLKPYLKARILEPLFSMR